MFHNLRQISYLDSSRHSHLSACRTLQAAYKLQNGGLSCAILADKLAIDEELVRLASHVSAIEQMLASDEPVGRKLDFQLQEASREINTIGSKCQNADIAKIVVKMKNEAEKIREQVQNIE